MATIPATKRYIVPQINWSHPLANYLSACIVPEFNERLTNIAGVLTGSNVSFSPDVAGKGLNSTSTAGSYQTFTLPSSAPLYSSGSTALTIVIYNTSLVPTKNGANNGPVITIATTSGNLWALYVGAPGTSTGIGLCQSRFTQATTTGTTFWASGTHVNAITFSAGISGVNFYLDGLLYENVATTLPAPDWTGTEPVTLFSDTYNPGADGCSGILYVAYIINKALSATEHYELAANPLALLDYGDVGLILFPPTIAGNGFTQYLEDNILNFFLRTQASFISKPTTLGLALCTNSPGNSGTIANEVPNTNSYARASIAVTDSNWSVPATGSPTTSMQISNLNTISWPAASGGGWGEITHIAICDSTTWGGGNVLFSLEFSAPTTVSAFQEPFLNPGDLVIQLD